VSLAAHKIILFVSRALNSKEILLFNLLHPTMESAVLPCSGLKGGPVLGLKTWLS